MIGRMTYEEILLMIGLGAVIIWLFRSTKG